MKLFFYHVATLLLFLVPFTNAQTITTYAGGGTGALGLGGPATTATLDDPIKGVFDKNGNYYFAQGLGQRVCKINLNGIITKIAGNGSSGYGGDGGIATASLLSEPAAAILGPKTQ